MGVLTDKRSIGYDRLGDSDDDVTEVHRYVSEDTGLLSSPSRHEHSSHARVRPGGGGRSIKHQRRMSSASGIDLHFDDMKAQIEKWSDKIVSTFGLRRGHGSDPDSRPLEIQHSVFQAPDGIRPIGPDALAAFARDGDSSGRMTKSEFDSAVRSVKAAIARGIHPTLISQGSSGSYFVRDLTGKVVAVFKPKDEEPYASRNPKWTKWIHRNLFPFFFGRACLIPNLSYVSEAAAYVLDCQLRTNIVPCTEVVSLSSQSFYYDYWDRRAFYRHRRPLPEKQGSFQIFLKGFKDATAFFKDHPWPSPRPANVRRNSRWIPSAAAGKDSEQGPDLERDSLTPDPGAPFLSDADDFWTPALQASLREQLERLVILDYIMRNTDRGLDNWMIRIDRQTGSATIVSEPPQGHTVFDEDMTEVSRQATPPNEMVSASLGAIDNSLSWPWKHPDAWRSYPFGWLFLPASLIGGPFSEATRNHFLPLLTSQAWWTETRLALRQCFKQDADFKEKMFAKQMAVMKGQAWNVVEALKAPTHGPLELARRPRVCVWDDIVEVPVAVPMNAPPIPKMRTARKGSMRAQPTPAYDEMDISSAREAGPTKAGASDLLMESASVDGSGPSSSSNRFNVSRQVGPLGQSKRSSALSLDSVLTGPPHSQPEREHGSLETMMLDGTRTKRFPPPVWEFHEPSDSGQDPDVAATGPSQARGKSTPSRRAGNARSARGTGLDVDDLAGDLGYAANVSREGRRKRVIIERLETVKGKPPTFSWC